MDHGRRKMVDCRDKWCIGRRALQSESGEDWKELNWHQKTRFEEITMSREETRVLRCADTEDAYVFDTGWTKDQELSLTRIMSYGVTTDDNSSLRSCHAQCRPILVIYSADLLLLVISKRNRNNFIKLLAVPVNMVHETKLIIISKHKEKENRTYGARWRTLKWKIFVFKYVHKTASTVRTSVLSTYLNFQIRKYVLTST